ncbi:hypothetical protein CRUP_015797 [Coryphaenoides rupestris]|nr:hypothetical protein CRUP_015797 [Coryphaenoides rupestris]
MAFMIPDHPDWVGKVTEDRMRLQVATCASARGVGSKPAVNDNADPSDGLMTMLKKIYTDGDDEMKRTINKAWSESQEKKLKGEDMMDL